MPGASDISLLPDAGPLITLAYAGALHLLFKPGWRVAVVDMVLHEVTRSQTPTSNQLTAWVASHKLAVLPTQTFARYQEAAQAAAAAVPASFASAPKKANLGELAVQETINRFALQQPPQHAVLLFEDHRVARTSFYLPEHCQKVSTRAFLVFLERKGWIASASEVERQAIQAGRRFSQLRFPSG